MNYVLILFIQGQHAIAWTEIEFYFAGFRQTSST